MKILYDGLIYWMQRTGGISRYFQNIINQTSNDIKPIILKPSGFESLNYPNKSNLRTYNIPFSIDSPRIHKIGKIYSSFLMHNWIKPDVLHPTYYDLLSWKSFQRQFNFPIIITVYDMIHERVIQYKDIKHGPSHVEIKKQAIFAADHIICISENTKKDLLEIYPSIDSSKVSVTHLASSLTIKACALKVCPNANKPYFLFVGSRDPHYKNFDGLLKAFSAITAKYPNCQLVVVGSPFNTDEKKLLEDCKLSDKVSVVEFVTDKNLIELYKNSIAFVYPSFYEGFGIPPLEAFQCGALVISSNSSSLPEVVDDAALTFDPKNTDNLSQLLEHALTMPESKRIHYLTAGLKQANKFSWEKTANKTEAIYKSLV